MLLLLLFIASKACAWELEASIALKQPGNAAVTHRLKPQANRLVAAGKLPVTVSRELKKAGNGQLLTVTLTAQEDVYFHLELAARTGFGTGNCDFYLPGFWYHKNLRSPKEAPSFHTSKSWNFREDRLSAPLTGVYDGAGHRSLTVQRRLGQGCDALVPVQEGEVILSGASSIGYVGFDNETGQAALTFGYPYEESPRRYIRKLTLAPAVTAFAALKKGESQTLAWLITEGEADDYGSFVARTWNECFDELNPSPLTPLYNAEEVKAQLTNYFRQSFVDRYPLKYNSGLTLRTADCKPYTEMQLGFCGRVLLNAFNEIEYGEQHGDSQLTGMGHAILESFRANGFTSAGYFHDYADFSKAVPTDDVHSIRQQSEAVYAVLHYLQYEKTHGRRHAEWESKVRRLLDNLVKLQKADGSFARKFRDDSSDIDASPGSTPSATGPLVMGYRYFGSKSYLQAARRSANYLAQHIISKSDYFSSTLDANCEDKEAAISAVTATYYMALVTKGKEQARYVQLCKQAAYFALSWYYLWDVPFAQGQMLGDLGFRSRGWGNVSVENNHVDVFVFEFPSILKWLGLKTNEARFARMYNVIYSSLNQLLPTPGRLCGIALPGFYPEVVQHTTWDYGKNGKGFYNDIFAPGWTVASLWELYSPERTPAFFGRKAASNP